MGGRVFVVAFLTRTAAADTWFQPLTTSDLRLFEQTPGIFHIKYVITIIISEIVLLYCALVLASEISTRKASVTVRWSGSLAKELSKSQAVGKLESVVGMLLPFLL